MENRKIKEILKGNIFLDNQEDEKAFECYEKVFSNNRLNLQANELIQLGPVEMMWIMIYQEIRTKTIEFGTQHANFKLSDLKNSCEMAKDIAEDFFLRAVKYFLKIKLVNARYNEKNKSIIRI